MTPISIAGTTVMHPKNSITLAEIAEHLGKDGSLPMVHYTFQGEKKMVGRDPVLLTPGMVFTVADMGGD